jgi:hypothetical protein
MEHGHLHFPGVIGNGNREEAGRRAYKKKGSASLRNAAGFCWVQLFMRARLCDESAQCNKTSSVWAQAVPLSKKR